MIQEVVEVMKQKADQKENVKDKALAASDTLVSHVINILELVRLEGVSDEELGEIIKQTVVELRGVRQNVIAHRKIERLIN